MLGPADGDALLLVAPGFAQSAAAVLLVGCRCGPLLLAVPMLGVGGRLVALGLGTLLLAPLLGPAAAVGARTGAALLPLCLRELLIGGALTLAASLPWATARSVGALFDDYGRPRSFKGRDTPLAAQLYGALALAIFFGLGGARIAVTALAASYELLPLPHAAFPAATAAAAASAAQSLGLLSRQLLPLVLALALPLLCAQLLAELFVAVFAKWLRQAEEPRPRRRSAATSLIWLVVLLLGAHALFPSMGHLINRSPAMLRAALDALAPIFKAP